MLTGSNLSKLQCLDLADGLQSFLIARIRLPLYTLIQKLAQCTRALDVGLGLHNEPSRFWGEWCSGVAYDGRRRTSLYSL